MIEIYEIENDNGYTSVIAMLNGKAIHEEEYMSGYGSSHENQGWAHGEMGKWLHANHAGEEVKGFFNGVIYIL